jgi:hypothetical protein
LREKARIRGDQNLTLTSILSRRGRGGKLRELAADFAINEVVAEN